MAFPKFLRLLAILVVMFAALAICSPTSNLNKRLHGAVLHVPAPGSGPWAIKSIQNVSWWCIKCSSADSVIIEIIKNGRNGKTVVFTTTGVNANSGTKDFVVDPKWATVGDKFFVRVTDKQHPNVSGKSSTFTVFKTQG
ncbi:5569_t:CDS:2 [Paraglomus brasilianum]|uniref:5569_t:CDS:1 n=1 Tax=Paraglomus brasilianum TaxID=144538 RepID=A0A9N9AHS1_9GLOM|nr:5569_t:CDS:2 [Paraglomus brasilianum]